MGGVGWGGLGGPAMISATKRFLGEVGERVGTFS